MYTQQEKAYIHHHNEKSTNILVPLRAGVVAASTPKGRRETRALALSYGIARVEGGKKVGRVYPAGMFCLYVLIEGGRPSAKNPCEWTRRNEKRLTFNII